MKQKRHLKSWVKNTIIVLPEVILIFQLFFIGSNITKIKNSIDFYENYICENDYNYWRCHYER